MTPHIFPPLAQSSCTRPDTEAESEDLRSIREQSEINCTNSVGDRGTDQKDEISDKLDENLPKLESEKQGALLLSCSSSVTLSIACYL